jgi:hypothetical protein
MKTIPTQSENPKGLHQRYIVEKANGEPIDENAEYFILRVDLNGSDPKHIAACRKALMTYANEIKDHLPVLSADLIERYGDNKSSPDKGDEELREELIDFAQQFYSDKETATHNVDFYLKSRKDSNH